MSKQGAIISIILFVVIVVGMFTAAYLKQRQLNEPTPVATEQEVSRYAGITRVTAKHFYIDGVHTLVGEIPMPTPCDLLESKATVAESFPEQITIDFSVINNAEFCNEAVTPQRFKVSATASAEANFRARFEGRDIELNLIPATEGESPDDFELFIKG